MEKAINGIHHITVMASDPQANYDFYVDVLGMRFIKKTVNYDAPDVYHLYYADEIGTPGTVLTFFPFPDAKRGKRGTGEISVVSFSVPSTSLNYWINRLAGMAIDFNGPSQKFVYEYITLQDPDGMIIEIVADPTVDKIMGWNNGDVPSDHSIRKFFGVTFYLRSVIKSEELLANVMGAQLIGTEGNIKRYSFGNEVSEAFVDLYEDANTQRGTSGAGTVHHIAWRTENDDEQNNWRNKVIEHGLYPTEMVDRNYFHSIYFREPGGILYEIATDGSGFMVDESFDSLGTELKLPPWHEPKRKLIEQILIPLRTKSFVKQN
ncbi:MAG: ring-cleaving dioxygenase [Ignavibacteria bacterium]|nr:ring-cleaving dioxygenase [Ignavibacteria bacterium]